MTTWRRTSRRGDVPERTSRRGDVQDRRRRPGGELHAEAARARGWEGDGTRCRAARRRVTMGLSRGQATMKQTVDLLVDVGPFLTFAKLKCQTIGETNKFHLPYVLGTWQITRFTNSILPNHWSCSNTFYTYRLVFFSLLY